MGIDDIIPIIISGGSGKRLWPISTREYPKQFAPIFSGKSTLQLTLERSKLISKFSPIIVVSKGYSSLVDKECKKLNIKPIMIQEEIGKNTCPAILFAVLKAYEINNLSNVFIMPSDHLFDLDKSIKNFIKKSLKYSSKFNWVTYGVKPLYPSESFGYIETQKSDEFTEVQNFIEKPNIKKAKEYMEKSNYFWNSGIFFGNSSKIIKPIISITAKIKKRETMETKIKLFCFVK